MPIKTSLARSRLRATPKRRAMMAASRASGQSSPRAGDDAEEELVSAMAAGTPFPEARQQQQQAPLVPDLFVDDPPIRDTLVTATSAMQDATVEECRPWLAAEIDHVAAGCNAHGVPHLDRPRHVRFLQKSLGRLPAPFTAADASRPWFFYWCLNGMALLGADVSAYRDRLVETARCMQNAGTGTGGFGGGFGQRSHLATTYAMVLALATVGGQAAYEVVDRRAMWKWLCALKQPDGGFQMSLGGEVDVRGAYCAAVVVSLLNLPLELPPDCPARTAGCPDLFAGLADYVRRCQTFEGGISGKPEGEAHGAYAFCALGCLAILDAPHRIFPRYLDIPRLISWLSSRQYAPEGGFSGRTNKLVDGCYSHWVGGCWPLIEASMHDPEDPGRKETSYTTSVHDLYSREGLIRYILSCGQDDSKRGGMRDKPSRPSDAYHTCYVLSGLSSAQHATRSLSPVGGEGMTAHSSYDVSPHVDGQQVFDEEDRVRTLDPVYVIPEERRKEIMSFFVSKPGF
ncbi:terpenoid cyclases/Protein prenyltransferase [Xylariaceae sp. FL0804]|nr:terpenoid cyclases/Protein prenyltransferase [Xylariaceae sp. FL0804]